MRLLRLDCHNQFELTGPYVEPPAYAILSHTWGPDGEEVSYDDIRQCSKGKKQTAGYAKLTFCAEQAKKDGLVFFWVDTCCIDKSSSAELSESINSMFRWYRNAAKCYVYLSDVTTQKRDSEGDSEQLWESAFKKSRWFTRGWTLQELLAPHTVKFFSRNNEFLGTKESLCQIISEITDISLSTLNNTSLEIIDPETVLSWASKRKTTRLEDQAYCLLGIFGISMPAVYGERQNAWDRLKSKIAKKYYKDAATNSPKEKLIIEGALAQIVDKRKARLDSLKFEQMNSRRQTIQREYSTTCQWLLEHPVYTDWQDQSKLDDHHGFLWIKGKPGAGKSTMVKFAYLHTSRHALADDIVISFFFNGRGGALEKTTLGMYRSLLFQLLSQAVDLQSVLDSLDTEFQTISEEVTWTIPILQDVFLAALGKLGQRSVTCFIDALDECDEQQVRAMVSFFEDVGQTTADRGDRIRTCLASRPYPTIDIGNACHLILERERGHSQDMRNYISSKLKCGDRKGAEEIKDSMLTKASGVFMWIVLVVEILNKEFRTGRITAVKKRLHEIPGQLSQIFQQSLTRDTEHIEDLKLSLQLLLFARRPMTVQEFYYALLAGNDSDPRSLAKWDPDEITIEDMTNFVIDTSKGLAELTQGSKPTVQFIHESVRDYLVKEKGLLELWPDLGEDFDCASEEKLKQCCYRYITVVTPLLEIYKSTSQTAHTKKFADQIEVWYPLLKYAVNGVLVHADRAAPKIPQQDFLSNFARNTWIQATNSSKPSEAEFYNVDTTLTYLLAECGASNLIRVSPYTASEFNTCTIGERFPILLAEYGEFEDAIIALLEGIGLERDIATAVEYKFPLERFSSTRLSPLLWAIRRRYPTIAEYLYHKYRSDGQLQNLLIAVIAEGYASLLRQILDSETPSVDIIHAVLSRVNVTVGFADSEPSVLKVLLSEDSWASQMFFYNVDYLFHPLLQSLMESMRDTGLTNAVCYEAMRSLLEKHNAQLTDIYLRDPQSDIMSREDELSCVLLDYGVQKFGHQVLDQALLIAVKRRHANTVKLLLGAGANASSRSDGVSILPLAGSLKCPGVVVELLAHEICVDDTDDRGMTALLHAAKMCDLDTARVLLNANADVNILDKLLDTPLLLTTQSSLNDAPAMMELLLAHGAHINIRDMHGRTPLSHAAEAAGSAKLEVLLRHNADMSIADVRGRTPFAYTARSEAYKNMEVLLPLINDVNAVCGEHGFTALHELFNLYTWSFYSNDEHHMTRLKSLLRRGADVTMEDMFGQTPLDYAARRLCVSREKVAGFEVEAHIKLLVDAYPEGCSYRAVKCRKNMSGDHIKALNVYAKDKNIHFYQPEG